jgi:SAM-dependent methyltransferase
MRCTDEGMIDVQRRLLSEICRVLKPGGSFYLATKNRFSLRNLIGKPDAHCYDVHFGSALPRWLSGFLVRLKGYPRPFGMLHSYAGLTAMLRDAGFDRIDSFWATPEMRNPTQYVPTDAASIREARRKPGFIQGENRSTRLLMPFIPASLVKYVTPGLAFLATKRR